MLRAFPIVYVSDVRRSVAFYEQFGFAVRYQHPSEGEPGYVKLARGVAEVGIVHERSPIDLIGAGKGRELRFELFVYVDDVDAVVGSLPADVTVLRDADDMPWGERIAYIADPDGNPVVLATVARR